MTLDVVAYRQEAAAYESWSKTMPSRAGKDVFVRNRWTGEMFYYADDELAAAFDDDDLWLLLEGAHHEYILGAL